MLTPWPAFKTLPGHDASPLEWALFYHGLGLWVYPIRDEEDRQGFRQHQLDKNLAAGMDEESARKKADDKTERSRKHTFVPWREHTSRPSLKQIKQWWTGRPMRGIALLTGKGKGIAVVDVDTAKGGIAAPWIGDEVLCLARTPSGGYHAYHLEIDDALGEGLDVGLDVRATGGLVAAPAGMASPGRYFDRFATPTPFPQACLDLMRSSQSRQATIKATTPSPRALVLDDDGEAELYVPRAADLTIDHSFTHALSTPAPDGSKNKRAKALIGLLARLAPLPNDATDAAIVTLDKWTRKQQGRSRLTADVQRALESGWRSQLKASTRSIDFALMLMRAWNDVWCSPPWDEHLVDEKVIDLWGTATRNEEHRQDEQIEEADEEDYKYFAPSLGSLYTMEEFKQDSSKVLLSCAALPPWQTIDGQPDTSHEWGHGWGEWLDEGLGGGICPEYCMMLGATNAKVGKTGWLDMIVDGLTLRSLLILSGVMDGPIIVPYYLTELSARDLTHRQLGRFFGIDNNVWRRGEGRAHQAPGLRHLAKKLGKDPKAFAAEMYERAGVALSTPTGIFAKLRELRTVFQPRRLKSQHDETEPGTRIVDHRRGIPLLRACAETMEWDRTRKAKQWGRDESQIWPLLLIDPVHRYIRKGAGANAVDALDEFVEEMRGQCTDSGVIIFASADTNKESAKGLGRRGASPAERAAGAFRGSQNALHLPDAALLIESKWSDDPDKTPHRAEITVGMSRWGPPIKDPFSFEYVPECGRFLAMPPTQKKAVIVDEDGDDDQPAKKKPPRKAGKFAKPKVEVDE
jgi:hypothetical protein